ncbi:HD domain-containing protein [Anoxybacillus flavithermus]|nr:HD domain-containing protein [Anoxybacillus flavithermus]MBE2938689.1 HD domain-containing protein [Anoxybacillus flavithermus]MBE2946976.1 HD domain-containing protein [Anoxybacillus flavithermus]MBE2949806.1 HD domain-containing protein [Anoxybacillus flavithermus]
MEVNEIAEIITERVNNHLLKNDLPTIDLNLIHAATFAHDIGHPPFGHSAERSLDNIMKCFGGFESNAQTIRIVTEESHNVTLRTVAALLKHKNVIPLKREEEANLIKGYYQESSIFVNKILQTYNQPVIEEYIIELADDISNAIYDIKDMVGFFSRNQFANILNSNTILSLILEGITSNPNYKNIDNLERIINCLFNEIKDNFLEDFLSGQISRERYALNKIVIEFIDSLEFYINPAKPYYSKIQLPLHSSLKLAILIQITKICFLKNDINLKFEIRIDDYIKRIFNFLFFDNHKNRGSDTNMRLIGMKKCVRGL